MNKRDLRAVEWVEELKSRRLDYSMNEISTPHKLTLEQILPGLPPKGIAASIDASELAVGEMKRILLDPDSIVRPPERWEEAPRRTRFWVEKDQWELIADHLEDLGLI